MAVVMINKEMIRSYSDR